MRLNAQRKGYTAARSDTRSTARLAAKVSVTRPKLASFGPFFTFFKAGGRLRRRSTGRRDRSQQAAGEEDDRIAREAIARSGPRPRMTDLVGLDVGTTGVKALRISSEERCLRAPRSPTPGDPSVGLGRAGPGGLVACFRDCAGRRAKASQSIGLSGQMHGLVALDDADRVLRPAILWNDQRTRRECAEIEERFGLRELVRLAGNRALPGFTAPKLLWLRKHEPDVYARIGHVLLPKDYVRLRLTGEHATDVADASGTLLFDVAAREAERRSWTIEIPRRVPTALESPRRLQAERRRVYCRGGRR